MLKEPTPHITKSGKYFLTAIGICVSILILTVTVTSCVRTSRLQARAERPWTQGYETPQGYMEPDHTFLYYWMAHSLYGRTPQPTYHIYVPPPNHPREYRPWLHYDRETKAIYTPFQWEQRQRSRPTQNSGGFSGSQPTQPISPPTRDSGGFSGSKPRTTSSPSQNSDGFSSKPRSQTSTPIKRDTGGFSRSEPKLFPTRDSGGFSRPIKPSQDSGGFSRKKK